MILLDQILVEYYANAMHFVSSFVLLAFFIKTKYSLKMPFVLFKYFSVIMTVQ